MMMSYFMTTVDGYDDRIYPDNYAGAYIDGSILVIQLTDISDYGTALYRRLLGENAPIRFKQVQYSWNQLTEIGEQFLDTISDSDILVVFSGVSTKGNVFNIGVERSGFRRASRYLNALTGNPPITIERSRPVSW